MLIQEKRFSFVNTFQNTLDINDVTSIEAFLHMYQYTKFSVHMSPKEPNQVQFLIYTTAEVYDDKILLKN